MAISNIFFSDVLMVPSQPRVSLPSTMRDLGFIKRDEILSRIAEMPIILTGGSIEYEKNTFFQYPSTRKVYFANGDEENIVIS